MTTEPRERMAGKTETSVDWCLVGSFCLSAAFWLGVGGVVYVAVTGGW